MSRRSDYLNTMLTHRLSRRQRDLDAAIEAALADGRDPDNERGVMVMSLVQTVRASLDQPPPEPSVEFAVLLEEGFAGSEISSTANDVPLPPVRVAASSRPPGRRMLGAAFAKVAALGLFAKLTLGGVAVAMAATGAGAAGMLPGPAQDAFDRASAIVLGERQRDDIAPEDVGRPDDGGGVRVEPEPGPVDRDIRDRIDNTDPADRGDDRRFGGDVSDPATQHRQDDTTRPGSPNGTDNVPSGNQHREESAPADPPANPPQDPEDPPSNTPHEPADPATSNPGGSQTPTAP